MSVKLQFDRPAKGGMVQRSWSFIGVNTLTGRHGLSSARTSLRIKHLAGKSTRIPSFSQVAGSIRVQQPEQVDKVFQALKKGLKEYLEGQKTELEFISSQQKDTIRNSRLAFFYDLDKEIRALERYILRLEFHISQVEGLYEAYCIQWRLCQGAVNMKQAFSFYPSSPASRESLLQLNHNHRHSLEAMCIMEGELEILLGELHIKMKGLIGFARLSPGDQYEVLIRLGRQRWRIRGQIQTDDKQLWDEEEMVFLLQVHESFEIKVTEIKGLSSVLVGMVTVKCAELYTAHPQMMVVDITELGTIKLQLEVVWNPFDSGMVKNLMLSASRQPSHSKRKLSMTRQFQDTDGIFSIGLHEPSVVFLPNYLSANAVSSLINKRASHPTIFPNLSMNLQTVEDDLLMVPLAEGYSTPENFQQHSVVAPNQEVKPLKWKVATDDLIVEEVEKRLEEKPKVLLMGIRNNQGRAVAMKLGLVQTQVATNLQEKSFPKAELKDLNLQIEKLNRILKRDICILQTASVEALDIEEEEVLGSFDFLTIDFNTEDNKSCKSGSRPMDNRFKQTATSRGKITEDTVLSLEQQHTEHLAKRRDSEDRPSLSTEEYTLDQALEIHLNICIALLRALRVYNLEYMQQYILQKLSCQTEVLEKIGTFTQRKTQDTSETDLWSGAPKLKNVMMLWNECCGSPPAFCCTANSFLRMLRRRFIHKVKAKLPGQADTVFTQLLQRIQSCSMTVPLAGCTTDLVSLFQLHIYLSHWKVTDFGQHISLISREVYFVSCLKTPKQRRALKKIKGRRILELQPMGQTLQLLAKLLTDESHKVVVSVTSCLCRASGYKSFRFKALVHYTWLLKDNDIRVQQQACLALKCLKAIESAEQVAELCHSTDEELRNTARETILSFDKKGYKAVQRMDPICAELQEDIYKNLKTEITVF